MKKKYISEGLKAFARGDKVNPYEPGTAEFRAWEYGFGIASATVVPKKARP